MDATLPMPIIDLERCDGCGLCIKSCPHGALAMREGKPVIVKPEACTYEGTGELVCPKRAISLPFEIVLAENDGKYEGGN